MKNLIPNILAIAGTLYSGVLMAVFAVLSKDVILVSFLFLGAFVLFSSFTAVLLILIEERAMKEDHQK